MADAPACRSALLTASRMTQYITRFRSGDNAASGSAPICLTTTSGPPAGDSCRMTSAKGRLSSGGCRLRMTRRTRSPTSDTALEMAPTLSGSMPRAAARRLWPAFRLTTPPWCGMLAPGDRECARQRGFNVLHVENAVWHHIGDELPVFIQRPTRRKGSYLSRRAFAWT